MDALWNEAKGAEVKGGERPAAPASAKAQGHRG
jgi:hypothetical protein